MVTHNSIANAAPAPAGRSLGSSNTPNPAAAAGARPANEPGVAEGRRTQESERTQNTDAGRTRPEEERENVVAVSEFGDTVQVSDEGNDELWDSRIGVVASRGEEGNAAAPADTKRIEAPEIEPPPPPPPPEPPVDEAKEAADAAAEEEAEEEASNEMSSSFAGISDQQLEQMYLDGSISRYDYQTEIEAREARDEEMRSETKDLTEEAAGLNTENDRTERMASAISAATSDQASETISVEDRLDAVESVANKEAYQQRREEEQGRLWDYQLMA